MQLMDYLAGELPAAAARALEEHLAVCPDCLELCRKWQQLDATLEHQLSRLRLSSDFVDRLRRRIQNEPAPVAGAARARCREQLETELRVGWVQQRRQLLLAQIPRLLDYLGLAAAIALGGYWLGRFLLRLANTSVATGVSPLHSLAMPLGLAVGALVFGATLGLAARRPLTHWLQI